MRRILPTILCAALYCSADLDRDPRSLMAEQYDTCFQRVTKVREAYRDEVMRRCTATARHKNEVMK
jgi:hypothetical protein